MVYLDVCCLNRPFDDQTQARIRLESEAVLLVLAKVEAGQVGWVSSDIVEYELGKMADRERWQRVMLMTRMAHDVVRLDKGIQERAHTIARLGFGGMDALHLASAEKAGADAFLTTDDRLIRLAAKVSSGLQVPVFNPVVWITGGHER